MTYKQALSVNIGDAVVDKKTGVRFVVTGKSVRELTTFKGKTLRLVVFRWGSLSKAHADVRFP